MCEGVLVIRFSERCHSNGTKVRSGKGSST